MGSVKCFVSQSSNSTETCFMIKKDRKLHFLQDVLESHRSIILLLFEIVSSPQQRKH